MSQRKHEPEVYEALSASGLSNREIARRLGVDESSVRRGLGTKTEDPEVKRASDRKHLLTDKGRARARRFRLRETLSHMTKRLKENS